MRKVIKVLICLIAFIAIDVHAIEFSPDKNHIYTHAAGNENTYVYFHRYGSNNPYKNVSHYIKDDKGEMEPMFCLDPTQLAPSGGGNDNRIIVYLCDS